MVALAFAVAFVAGMNFFSILNFWPLTISAVYDPFPVKIGLRGISPSYATSIGAIFWSSLLSIFPGGCRWILLAAASFLTIFGGALACLTPNNVSHTQNISMVDLLQTY